jgi:tellurite resistance protein
VWQYVLVAAITAFIGGIAIRTVIAISRRQFLPRPPITPPITPPIAPSTAPESASHASPSPVAVSQPVLTRRLDNISH